MKQLIKIVLPLIGTGGLLKYTLLGVSSGLFSFLFIHFVTRVISLIVNDEFKTISPEYIIIFTAIILLIVWIRKTLFQAIIHLSQTIFWSLRKQVLSLILNASYQQLSERKSKVHAALLNDVYVLTDASMSIVGFTTSLILAIACLAYLASISLLLFAITLVIALLGVTVYQLNSRKNNAEFEEARALETAFVNNFNTILDGFKEIYMEPRKGRALFKQRIAPIAGSGYENNVKAYTGFLNNQITGQVLFYVLITSILLFFSILLKISLSDTVSFVFTLIYLLSSIETIMALLPNLTRAGVASTHLMALKKDLEEAGFNNQVPDKYIRQADFAQITVHALEFHYGRPGSSFGIGPIDFHIGKGDVAFIYGGNGSGKTTFAHAILGLCVPSAGEIRLNGAPVTSNSYTAYRTAFSVVFSNFFLFDEILGVDHVDRQKWEYYIRLFELEEKVILTDKKFSTTDLSMGQRKRLALIAALLEEKPVLFMDEWAADQDPHFKHKFYTQIIPILKQEGFTIIAITHDDKYYHCADKLYRMDFGRLIEERFDLQESNFVS